MSVLFLSHGGGPLPLLGDAGHQQLVAALKKLAAELPRPEAILVVSAHWETEVATVTTATEPALIYDYGGFPPESYQITYPCPGSPELADSVVTALQAKEIAVKSDAQRGLDHGVFVPLKVMYPEASIPVVQLSLLNSLDPAAHLSIGQALRELEVEKLLVIGSGFSFHNLRAFFTRPDSESLRLNQGFERWLRGCCGDTSLSESERWQQLIDWQQVPGARFCHPRPEHLLPLHCCVGLAGSACSKVIPIQVMQRHCSLFVW
ncbi:dioxygenase [Ectothiorhodospiraceae bacterium BW-2]|nr:dioxygenase [Ectothiorhodospiraceae bacterium BW-2]